MSSMTILHVPRTSKNKMHQSFTFMLTSGCLFTYRWLTCVSDECWDLNEKAPTSKNTWDQIADQLDSIGSSLHHVFRHKLNRTLIARPSKKVGIAKLQLLDTQGPRGYAQWVLLEIFLQCWTLTTRGSSIAAIVHCFNWATKKNLLHPLTFHWILVVW